jgi:two-component system CheB/CheR fusion protein
MERTCGLRASRAVDQEARVDRDDPRRDFTSSQGDRTRPRNLLIYLNSELQGHVIPIFHYALKPQGYLFLGTSENITQHGDLFTSVDKKNRVFQRRKDGAAIPQLPTLFRRHGIGGAGHAESKEPPGAGCARRAARYA